MLTGKKYLQQNYKKRADADSCKAAGVMRRARLADVLHMLKVSVLRGGYKRAIMTVIIIMGKVFDVKQKKKRFGFDILN